MRARLSRLFLAAVLLVVVSTALSAGSAQAASPSARVGAAPALPREAHVIGSLSDVAGLRLTIALAPRDPDGLAALATAISKPGSADFRRYLTVAQFARRFGATPAHAAAVESALRNTGLAVGNETANHLTIPVTGTAAQVERAFSISLSQVKLPNGRVAYANTQAPRLASGIAGYVQGVIGLDDVTPDEPAGDKARVDAGNAAGATITGPLTAVLPQQGVQARNRREGVAPHVVTGGPQPCFAAQGAQEAFQQRLSGRYTIQANPVTADQAASAYGFASSYGAGDFGAGQTIAMFEEEPYNPVDIQTYESCFGISAPVANVDVDGGPGPYQAPPTGGGDGESALDIEQAMGFAPQASILVYEGPENGSGVVDILSQIVSQNRAQEISSSYGACEALIAPSTIMAQNTLLQEAAAQGQSFFSASGDSGAEMCSQVGTDNFSLSVEDPAAQPFATGVGGTSMTSDDAPPAEGVWNDGPSPACGCTSGSTGGGSGGGISARWTMPSYQSGAASTVGTINANSSAAPCAGAVLCREVPDVSVDGDQLTGYVVEANDQWTVIGGTSAGAPLWAAFTALVNASPACRGLPVGFLNPALYAIAGRGFAANFNDIISPSPFTHAASNDTLDQFGAAATDPAALYPVAHGYDMSTGLGSPIGGALAGSLCALRAPAYTVAVTSPGTRDTVRGRKVSSTIHASDSGGAKLTYSASGLPAGLGINSSSGLISGTPTALQTTKVTVAASDPYRNAGSTSFMWRVFGRPTTTAAKLSGLGNREPSLSFILSAGAKAPALKSLAITLPRGLSFATNSKTLAAGITVKASKKKDRFSAKVKKGVLTIRLRSAITKASLGIHRPAINISAEGVGTRRKHKLTIRLKVTYTSRTSIKLTISPKLS